MSNVVALPGYSAPSTEAVQEIVDILEEALADAKSGKIIGLAIVTAYRGPLRAVHQSHAAHDSSHTVVAGAAGLMWSLGKSMGEEEA
jgi:hypothetical protein